MLYKNTNAMVCSPKGDTDFFDIVAGVLQGDTLVPHLFIICLDYVLQMSIDLIKENGFTQKKKQEADHIKQRLEQTGATKKILHFLQIHRPKLNPY